MRFLWHGINGYKMVRLPCAIMYMHIIIALDT